MGNTGFVGGNKRLVRRLLGAAAAAFLFLGTSGARADYIEDNSFLLEEAYNQEPGVVQHISAAQFNPHKHTWLYTFTQEWPVPGQRHQLSYTIPALRNEDAAAGLGDVLLNYRYQVIGMYGDDKTKTAYEAYPLAFSPRLSLILPTGDWERGNGRDSAGVQVNLPFSYAFLPKFVAHVNLGATWTPRARGPSGRDTAWDNNYGASLVYHLVPTFDLLCELAGGWTDGFGEGTSGTAARLPVLFLNPGVRGAINLPGNLQIVPGAAYSIGIGPSRGEHQIFFYLSFEH